MKNSYLQGKRALPILLVCLMGLAKAMAQSFTVGDLNYTVNEDGTTVTVTGHVNGTAATGSLVIPESVTYEGSSYVVKTIGEYAFSGCSGFTGDLLIPNSVTSIGNYAFQNFSGFMGSLTIPNYLSSIGRGAFYDCSGFTEVHYNATNCTDVHFEYNNYPFCGCHGSLTIGENVDTIPNYMFKWSAFTGNLIIPNSVSYIGDNAFCECGSFTGSLTIGNSVTSIDEFAFYGCSGFTGSLTIGNSVATVGRYAFSNCSGFTGGLIIPNSVTTIGYEAFSYCSGFTGSLTIGNSVTGIEGGAFYGCSGFTEIYYNAINCGSSYSPFIGCTSTLIIGENVQRIPEDMFSGASFTGDLTIPNSVTSIGHHAFGECSSFTGRLTIGISVASIETVAFSGCSSFSEVYYNATNCADVGSYNFSFVGCGGSLIIGDNVERIPAHMFENGGFNGTLSIPNSVTDIGANAFSYCSGFTGDLVIPGSITTIREGTFSGCSGFSGNLFISEGVTTIGLGAFMNCSGFSGDLVIPSTVTAIGYDAFTDCNGFLEVFYNATNCANASHYSTFSGCGGTLTIGENVERIPDYLFMNAAFSGDLIIPNFVTSLGGSSFQDCIGLTSLTIGDSLAEIGSFAFAGCSNFSSITAYAVQPPIQVPYGAFQDVPKDIPIYVPCDLVDEYQSSMYWDEFTNYVEALPYHLTVEAVEPEYCTVSIIQHPSCEESRCIVKAEPAEGYVFVAWEEEGTVVSTDAVYTFTVDRDIHVVARVKNNTSVSEGTEESIVVYPNPTYGKICIKSVGIKNVGVYNLLGQSLFECESDGDEFIYDFSKHSTGIYLIRVETSSGIAVKKVSVR